MNIQEQTDTINWAYGRIAELKSLATKQAEEIERLRIQIEKMKKFNSTVFHNDMIEREKVEKERDDLQRRIDEAETDSFYKDGKLITVALVELKENEDE